MLPCGWPTCLPCLVLPALQATTPVYIPATIFLVTDHLYHLLVKNYMRRDKASGASCAQECIACLIACRSWVLAGRYHHPGWVLGVQQFVRTP